MITIKGSHGTTKDRAAKIRSNGFVVSGGRFLKGAYFWRESYFYIELAIGWYKDRHQAYITAGESSPSCAVILADLSCNDTEFLDLDRQDFRDRFAQLAEIKGVNQYNNRQIFALYTLAIKEMEKRGGVIYKIFLLRVPPPTERNCPRYPVRLHGHPTSVIARSNDNILMTDIHYPKV